jgi:hypothetical protein
VQTRAESIEKRTKEKKKTRKKNVKWWPSSKFFYYLVLRIADMRIEYVIIKGNQKLKKLVSKDG